MQFQNEALYYNFKSDANTHESYPKPLCIENANSLNTTFTLHLLVPCWLFLCAVCLCRIWLKMKWSRWQCHSSILLAGQIMVPQTLAVNFLRLASFSSLPPPVGMVLAPSLYIAGVIHGGIKGPPLPLHTHTQTLLFDCVIFSKIQCSCQVSHPGTNFQMFWIRSCDCWKECIMVKPPGCAVWNLTRIEPREGRVVALFWEEDWRKFIACNFLVTIWVVRLLKSYHHH